MTASRNSRKRYKPKLFYLGFAAFLLAVTFALYLNSTTQGETSSRELARLHGINYIVPSEEIISGGPPKDGIPSIDRPKFVLINEAEKFIPDSTLGMLVKHNNTAKFYPYNILLWHEIVNDNVGGKPLSVTFCPLCATGIVFEREIDGKLYDFGTSGKLYKSNLVMYDRQTDSYWSQALGKSIAGRLAGTELKIYMSSIMEFGIAKANEPDLLILSTDTGHIRDYAFNPYSEYESSDYVGFGTSFFDDRLHPKILVYGIIVNGKSKAYDYFSLINTTSISDAVGGNELLISVDKNNEITVFDRTENKNIIGIVSFWFSWAIHNPDSELWFE